MSRSAIAVAALILLVAACGGEDEPVAVSETGLRLELSSPGGPAGGPVPVTVTLTNDGETTVTVARPFFAGNIVAFTVTDDGGSVVPFDGPFAELRPLSDDRVVVLGPGKSVSHEFDLAEHFMLESGDYAVGAEYRFQP